MFTTSSLNKYSKELRNKLIDMERANHSITNKEAVSILFHQKAKEVKNREEQEKCYTK